MKMIAGLLLLAASQQVPDGLARFQLYTECRPIDLVVESLSPSAAAINLTRERVTTLAESRLRAARLFSDDAVLQYVLGINVHVMRQAFAVTVKFAKPLFDPISGQVAGATTWDIGITGTHGGDGSYIVQALSELMDQFVLEYLRANEDACR